MVVPAVITDVVAVVVDGVVIAVVVLVAAVVLVVVVAGAMVVTMGNQFSDVGKLMCNMCRFRETVEVNKAFLSVFRHRFSDIGFSDIDFNRFSDK